MNRLFRTMRPWSKNAAACFAILAVTIPAGAQFKVTGPAPYPDAEARQRIKTLLENTDSNNRNQTVDTLTGLLAWYRNIIDDELIAAWQTNKRPNLPDVIKPLADARVAAATVDFSWRQQRQTAFLPEYAPMFEDLMIRFPDSGRAMLADLQQNVDLSPAAEQTVCRILIDMPDTGSWQKSAQQILPRYRATADRLLARDLQSDSEQTRDRAQYWVYDLRSSMRDPAATPAASSSVSSSSNSSRRRMPSGDRPTLIGVDPGPVAPAPAAKPSPQVATAETAPTTKRPSATALPAAPVEQAYSGPMSGTLECSGSPIPQNAEYVFRNLPPMKLQLDYDTKVWDARLTPGEGQTQRLILKNKASGAQKRCVVHWTVSP